ncbi:MAG: hypothetical protein A3G24_09765 [Betaproteobacteria bacterium RIFCSPLOWO2_12_FULL_62_13]|nr:MAG: hypothetical protein A3G24_09765 [Betaproteobacteria bacterium RIFCSPLOWO2_12_FULL_62_13]
MGVVSGVLMSFQFGTNWPGVMNYVGNVAGPRTLRTGVALVAVLAPVQAFLGDLHGLNTLEHQPAKIAAVEAIWHTGKGVPLVQFAIPNEKARRSEFTSQTVRENWFGFPRTLGLMPLPLASAAVWLWLLHQTWRLKHGKRAAERGPLAGAIVIYVLAFAGLAYSLFPYVVMDRITIWDAAARPSSLKVVLAGALIVLPFIIAYTVYAYRVFRGKASAKVYE